MTFSLLTPDQVVDLHDAQMNPGELQGRAGGKSLEGALARVDNRLAYGLIADICDLAAAYAVAVAQGHCFNDGNKRAAFRAMDAILILNGVHPRYATEDAGQVIIRAAQGLLDEGELAYWLRQRV